DSTGQEPRRRSCAATLVREGALRRLGSRRAADVLRYRMLIGSGRTLARGLFEVAEVLECVVGVAAKDRFSEEPEERAEDAAAHAWCDFAAPDHLDATSAVC